MPVEALCCMMVVVLSDMIAEVRSDMMVEELCTCMVVVDLIDELSSMIALVRCRSLAVVLSGRKV